MAISKGYKQWCRRGDLNPYALSSASPSSWCVCQFRHSDVVLDFTCDLTCLGEKHSQRNYGDYPHESENSRNAIEVTFRSC